METALGKNARKGLKAAQNNCLEVKLPEIANENGGQN